MFFLPFIDEPDFGPVDKVNSCKASSSLYDITIKSAAIVVIAFLGVNSMQDVTVVKHLYPLAKKLTVKHCSFGKYQLSVKIAEALISQGYIEVKSPVEGCRDIALHGHATGPMNIFIFRRLTRQRTHTWRQSSSHNKQPF